MPVLEAAIAGFGIVFSWPNILYPIAATLVAMVFAFLPGLSGATLMALAISFTLQWDPVHVMLVFGAFTGGATFTGSITAILFNIPGTSPSAATLLDGYPMARRGEARTAIAAAALSSALGSTVGVLVLIALLPFLRDSILAFGPAEFLMLAIWGLATIAGLTGPSVWRGLAAAGLGMALAMVGMNRRTAEPRWTFGVLELQDGLGVVPVFLGFFAVTEMLRLARSTPRSAVQAVALQGSTLDGMRAVARHWRVCLRGSLLGSLIGMIPAVGGTVAGFLAYGDAKAAAGAGARFGEGDIRGVIAPEASHDAKDGGSLAPTLAFGIPGSEGTAVLLSALTLHGFAPGKQMLTSQLTMAFVLIWSLFLSNWLTSLVGLALAQPLAKLTLVPLRRLAPLILLLAVWGAYGQQGRVFDVLVALLCGVAGYLLKSHGFPVVPLVTAFVLTPLFETNLQLTLALQTAGRIHIWDRPLVWVLAGAIALMVFWPRVRAVLRTGRPVGGDKGVQ
jgi:TctA family transporter